MPKSLPVIVLCYITFWGVLGAVNRVWGAGATLWVGVIGSTLFLAWLFFAVLGARAIKRKERR